MSGFRGGSGGGSDDPVRGGRADFLTNKYQVGDQEFSIASILIVVGVLAALFGTSSLIGFFTGVGLQVIFGVVIVWMAWKYKSAGLIAGLFDIASTLIFVTILSSIIMVHAPRWVTSLPTSGWESVWSGVMSGSGQALPGVDTGLGYDPNVGGGLGDYGYSNQPQPQYAQPVAPTYGGGTAEAPVADPQQARLMTLQMDLLRAVESGDGASVEVLINEIVSLDPGNTIAKQANERLSAARTLVRNTQMIQGPTGALGAKLNAAELADVKRVLAGGSYTVISNGAKMFSLDCNEEALLQITAPPLARGNTFVAKRCVIHKIAGNSDTGTTFTVR